MVRSKLVKWSIAAAMLFGVNMAFGANAISKYKAKAEDNFYKYKYRVGTDLNWARPSALTIYNGASGLTWSSIKGVYAFNKASLDRYGYAVVVDEKRVANLKEDLRVARKDNAKNDKVYLKRQLKKARLDRFRDQMHYMVDREALRQDYLMVIDDHKRELASDREDLCKAKANARKNKGDNTLDLKKVELKKKEIKADKMAIANERKSLDKEMAKADEILE